MEITIVENMDEEETARAYMDGYIDIQSVDAVRFEMEFNALVRKYEQ